MSKWPTVSMLARPSSTIMMTLALSAVRVLAQLLLVLITLLVITLWPFIRKRVRRASLTSVAGPPRPSFVTGNLPELFDPNSWEHHRKLVKQYGGAFKVYGLLGEEIVYLSDPKALTHILLEKQDIYERTDFFLKANLVCLGPSLVSLEGTPHKRQRKMLSPIFSPNQIKALTPIFHKVSDELREAITLQLGDLETGHSAEIDMLHWVKRTALELIGQGGLGYSFGRLDSKSANEYSDAVRNFAPMLTKTVIVRQFLPFFSQFGSASFRRWAVKLLPIDSVQKLREIVDAMDRTARLVLNDRKGQPQSEVLKEENSLKNVDGKDLMSILLAENAKSSEEDRLSEEELEGIISTFIFGGQDTTTGAISYALHEFALHPDAQERLRKEVVDATVSDEHLSFADVHKLPYLDSVVRETLRIHPPIYIVQRTNIQDDVLPLSRPVLGADGSTLLDSLPLRKDTTLLIAIEAANRNPDLWGPDAGKWRPERWLSPLPRVAEESGLPSIYSHIVTFFAGNRSCIGFKFAELEMKIVLSTLVRHFRFELPKDKKLAWKLGGIASPGVENDPIPKLPLRVSRV